MNSTASQPERPVVIGLMGAPGSGKSTVARAFEQLGCAVIDADQFAAEALADPGIQSTLAKWWGADLIRDGQVDRKRLGSVVFSDPDARAKLESVIHPFVNQLRLAARQRFAEQCDPPVPAIIEDCPLLLEVGLDKDCDFVIFVDSSLALRQQRVKASRGWSAQELARREESQAPLDTKRARADYTIDNALDLAATDRQIQRVFQQIIELPRLNRR